MVVKLNRDLKLRYLDNAEISKNSKPFWNAHSDSKIILIEKEEITNNSDEVIKKETLLVKNDETTKTFNKHFAETVETLNTFEWPSNNTELLNDQVTAIIKKFQNHPSIKKLNSKYNLQEKFSFKSVPVNYLQSLIKNIPNNKAARGEIPLHILKQCGFTYQMLTDCINNVLYLGIFPDSLKCANITPVHKKDEATDKQNYRPVSVLPLLSKVFEKVIYDQLSQYLDKYLNSLLCGFRKAHSSKHALFKLLQALQEELDKSGYVRTILMDLSKAYNTLPHDVLAAKFEAYGIDKNGLNLLCNYLTNCKQRTKVSFFYSDWYDIVRGVPQGSILGPLFFNLFVNDLFLFIERTNICNFADDNTISRCSINLQTILKDLKFDMENILTWFKVNSMKPNPKKFQFMVLGRSTRQSIIVNINNIKIIESSSVTLLGFTIDH